MYYPIGHLATGAGIRVDTVDQGTGAGIRVDTVDQGTGVGIRVDTVQQDTGVERLPRERSRPPP